MNDNTILRIKVPAHLYESVKEQLTLNEAKGKAHYGAGMEVVKEKKAKPVKDGMHQVDEGGGVGGFPSTAMGIDVNDAPGGIVTKEAKKPRSLEELKKAHKAIEKKIQEMEGGHKVKEASLSEDTLEESPVMDAVSQFISNHGPEALMALISTAGAGLGSYLSKKEKETGKPQLPKTTAFRGR